MISYIKWILLAICVISVMFPLLSSQADKDQERNK